MSDNGASALKGKDQDRRRPRLSIRTISSTPYQIASSYGIHNDEIYTPFVPDSATNEDIEPFPQPNLNEISDGDALNTFDPAPSPSNRKTSFAHSTEKYRNSSFAAQAADRRHSVNSTYCLRRRSTAFSAKPANIVTWNDIDDPENPRNWSLTRKWTATTIVSLFTFMAPVASSMIAPSLMNMAEDLGITSKLGAELMLSIFILGFAVGPLIFGPLSEIYGRVVVLQGTNLLYLAFNLACGFATSESQMLAFRFLSGVGGSAPAAIGGGVLGDCWWPEERGKAVAAYSLAPLAGASIGPIMGGFIAQSISWRWVFWTSSIGDACIQLFGVLFLQETFGPELLRRRAKRLREQTGNMEMKTEYELLDTSVWVKVGRAVLRPFRLLLTQPIVQVLSLYMACIYGLTYLVYASFPTLWMEGYGQSMGMSGLHYISMSVGFFLGSQIIAPLNDRIYRALKKRNDGTGRPEYRCPVMIPGSLLVAAGLFWYGWSAEARLHWIMPDLGMVWFSLGCDMGWQAITAYLVDSYTRYAASAVAASIVLRSIAGFGFPLFAPIMYNGWGYGWSDTFLGFASLAFGLPAPLLLWKYGHALRKRSPFAAGD